MTRPRLGQAIVVFAAMAAGGMVLLASLWMQWGYDRAQQPDEALDAWQVYGATDIAQALLGAVVIAGAVAAWRRPAAAAVGGVAAGLAAANVLRLLVQADPGRGAKVALAGAVVALGGAVLALVELPVPGRPGLGRLRASRSFEELWQRLRVEAPPAVRRSLRYVGSTWFLAPVAVIAVYPFRLLEPSGGLDESWIVGLHLAARDGLDFGTEIVFTYGPLGYLTVPRLVDPGLFVQGIVYELAAYLAAAFAILAVARRTFPTPVAFFLAVLALDCFRIVAPEENAQIAVTAAALLATAAVVRSPTIGASRWWWPVLAVGAVIAAGHVLVKLNTGLLLVGLVGVAALGGAPAARRLRSVVVVAGTFVAALVVWWIVAGQPLAALDDYLLRSKDVVAGFSTAMYDEEPGREWEYLGAAAVLVVLASTLWRGARALDRWRAAALAIAVAAFTFVWFKQGFVRHDGHHVQMFFAAVLPAALAAGWWPREARATALAVCGVAVLGLLAVARPSPYGFHSAADSWTAYEDLADRIADADELVARHRRNVQKAEAVDARALALLRGQTVHVHPNEAAAAWAHGLRWRPLPTMQAYVGYTEKLDELNAETLADDQRAPSRILLRTEGNPLESPRAHLGLFCGYEPLHEAKVWAVLGRLTTGRCGRPRPVGSVSVPAGEAVPVPEPRPDEAILVRVGGIDITGTERLRAALWKPYVRSLQLGEDVRLRIPPDHQGTPILLRAGRRASVAGLSFGDDVERVAVSVATEGLFDKGRDIRKRPVTIEFLRMRINVRG